MSFLTVAWGTRPAKRRRAGRQPRRTARRSAFLKRTSAEPRWRIGLWAVVFAAACGGLAWAQQDADPFAAPAAPAAAPVPAAAAPAAAARAAAAPAAPAAPIDPDPAVDAVLAADPQSPEELIRAARLLADLDRPNLARAYLARVLAANLTPVQATALARRMGVETFTRLAARPELAPEAGQLASRLFDGLGQELTAPDQMSALVARLGDPSPAVRQQAVEQLRPVRMAALGAILAALGDARRPADERVRLRRALVDLGGDLAPPLVGALETDDPSLEAEVIAALGDLRAQGAELYLLASCYAADSDAAVRAAAQGALERLLGRVPEPGDAVRVLIEQSERYLEQRLPLREDADGRVEIWSWDDQQRQPSHAIVSAADASRLLAARLAREAYRIDPERPDVRALYLVTMLEQAAYETGLDQPLATAPGTAADRALAMELSDLERALVYALDTDHPAAATAIVRLMGRLGGPAELLHEGPEMSPLVRATQHADRRLSFAAAEAVLALKPAAPFAGSSFVPELLSFVAATRGAPRAIVAGPSLTEAQRIAGYLAALGYDVDVALTGRELVRRALASPDYELALVAATLTGPTVNIALQQLRHIPRTAALPVGVLAEAGQSARAARLIGDDRLAAPFIRPHRQEDVDYIVGRVRGLAGPQAISFAERQAQAARAVPLLAEISAHRRLYNVLRIEDSLLTAGQVPGLTTAAAAVLGTLGTAESQKTLVDLASRNTLSVEVRAAAATAFCGSVERFGILLTTDEIVAQYERYNQSAPQGPAARQILGSILDCLEAPARQAPVAEQVSQPAAPGASVQR